MSFREGPNTPRKFFAGIISVGLLAAFIPIGQAAQAAVKTPAEEAGYKQYSQNEAIAMFLSKADALAKELSVVIIGRTQDVRGFPSKDIYLCILTEEGAANPQGLNRAKPTVFLTASQHGNEQSAKEAVLRLIRDFSLGDLKQLLKKINVLAIPQTNPFGNFFDIRQNEIALDMNRDHVKLEAEGVRAIHRAFRAWMPEVSLDVHEKGDDFYRVSVGCVSNLNIHPSLQEFSRRVILDDIAESLKKKNITFHEYLVTEDLGMDTSSGARLEPQREGPRETMKRYSTTDLNDGRNSPGIYETLSFIQEGASRHDLETLDARTRWQYFGIKSFTESVAEHAEEILSLVGNCRARLIERAKVQSGADPVHLRLAYVRDPKQPELALKKFERAEPPVRGVLATDKKAGDLLTARDIAPYPMSPDMKVVSDIVINWFPNVETRLSVVRPAGYVIPAAHADVIETLLDHGVVVETFTQDKNTEVGAYQIKEIVPSGEDYLAPEQIEVEKKALSTIVKKGDFYISCFQEAANLIPCLLEPQSEYGFIRYWKFKLVPEKGGFFALFRLEKSQPLPLVPYKEWAE